jgi:hypothetical protein
LINCIKMVSLLPRLPGRIDEAGRQAHLNGPIAQALGANTSKLLAQAPSIERIDVLGTKLPG